MHVVKFWHFSLQKRQKGSRGPPLVDERAGKLLDMCGCHMLVTGHDDFWDMCGHDEAGKVEFRPA